MSTWGTDQFADGAYRLYEMDDTSDAHPLRKAIVKIVRKHGFNNPTTGRMCGLMEGVHEDLFAIDLLTFNSSEPDTG